MAKQVASFQQLVDFLGTLGVDSEQAVPIAENFMGEINIDFDADGNFAPIQVDYLAADHQLKRV